MARMKQGQKWFLHVCPHYVHSFKCWK